MPAYLGKILIALLLSLAGILLLLWIFSTKLTTTAEDEIYIQAYIKEWGLPENIDSIPGAFAGEIAFINRIQDSVIHSIQGYNKPIPKEKVGNIRFYFEMKTGACYDRALLMEKLFTRFGLQTRHIFVFFRDDETPTRTIDILRKKLPSHALLEIKTSKGWMVIDTQTAWMGIDEQGNPLTLAELRYQWKVGKKWDLLTNQQIPAHLLGIHQNGNFKFVYGLYSRHGGFLPQDKWIDQLRKWGYPHSRLQLFATAPLRRSTNNVLKMESKPLK